MGGSMLSVVVAVAGMTLLLGTCVLGSRYRLRLFLLALLLLVSALAIAVDWTGLVQIRRYTDPLAERQDILFGAIASALAAVSLLGGGRDGVRARWGGAVTSLLAMLIYAGVVRLYHTGAVDGALTIVLAVIVVPATYTTFFRVAEGLGGLRSVVRLFILVGYVWIGMSFVQFAIDPGALVDGGRFMGLLGNPQHAAAMLAMLITLCAWLAANDRRTGAVISGVAGCGFLLMLFWTGSRTGMLMAIIGVGVALLPRLGRLAILAPVGGGVLIVLISLAQRLNIELRTSRLTSLQDTRSQNWMMMIRQFYESPLLGVGTKGLAENSYLAAGATFGIGMVMLMIIFLIACGVMIWRAWSQRSTDGPDREAAAVLVVAGTLAYLAGAMFEAYLFARTTYMLVFIVFFAGVYGRYFLEASAEEAVLEDDGEADPDDPWFDDHAPATAGTPV